MTTPTNEAGHGLPELPLPWSDYWASKGNWALSHNYAAFELADEWLRANLDALALSRGVPESGRYFVDGPQGSFFTSDKTFADLFVREVDDPDDWTITDLSNPTGTAPAAAGAQGEVPSVADVLMKTDDPIQQMRMVVQVARENDSLISRKWVEGWADQWERERSLNTPQPAAADGGVRERARELLAFQYGTEAEYGTAYNIRHNEKAISREQRIALRAIEQALTQQCALSSHRQAGEPVAVAKTAAIWIGENEKGERIYATSVKWLKQPQECGATIHLYTAPPPGPDLSKFRELAEKWRTIAGVCGEEEYSDGARDAFRESACELLALVEKGAGNG